MTSQPPAPSSASKKLSAANCPACGSAASGRFCANCGATLDGARCSSCGKELGPGAKFCESCGAPAARAAATPRSSSLPWVVAALSLVIVFAMLAGRAFSSRRSTGEPRITTLEPTADANAGTDQQRIVRAPDISSLSAEERADRLFNRVMLLNSQGKSDSVQFFAPMALTAYQMLGALNADQRYDMGRIAEVAGAVPLAKAEADSILQKNPTHLLGLILAARVAALEKNSADVRAYEKRLVAAAPSEIAKKLEEYDRHATDITNGLAEARRDLGLTR